MTTPQSKCPVCGKPSVEKVKPFCSPRCATLDLGQWLGEGYRVPQAENTDDEESLPNPGNNGENDEEIG